MASRLWRSSQQREPTECQCRTRLRPAHRRLERPAITPVEIMDSKNCSTCLMTFQTLRDLHTTKPTLLRQPHPPTRTLPSQRHTTSAPTQTFRNSSSKITPDEYLNSKPLLQPRFIRESLMQIKEIRLPHLNRSLLSETPLTQAEVCWP